MTNSSIAQAVATERISQLHLEAERDQRAERALRAGPRPRPSKRLQQAWSWTAHTPSRFRAFILAGQLGPAYRCTSC